MLRLQFDLKERAKYLVNGFFASMDAMFEDTDTSAAEIMRDVTLAYIFASRQVFEDRLAAAKPVTQENFDNLESVHHPGRLRQSGRRPRHLINYFLTRR